jgi:hypothetical protein
MSLRNRSKLACVSPVVYLKTDCLRYSFFLHALINGISTVVLPILMGMAYRSGQGTDLQKVSIATVIMSPGVLLLLLFVIMLFVLFFFGVRKHDLSHDGIGMRTVFSSWGMMLFVCITGIALL